MMEINYREIDYDKDSKAVVDLINDNLKSGFTVDVLKWKHLNGAFGPSKNVVAVDGDRIVAVVFAMRYNYRDRKGNIIKGIRTFDGCTKSEYRGRGIFKKVMRMCVDKFENDYDFLMANPNEASFAEHIKLGYVEPSKDYFYHVGFINPFKKSRAIKVDDYKKSVPDGLEEFGPTLGKQDYYLTGNSLNFLNWRYYPDNYRIRSVLTEKGNQYISYRIIKKKGFNVLVLCDFYGDNASVNETVLAIAKIEKAYCIYYLHNAINDNLDLIFSKRDKKAVIVFKLNNFTLPENLVISLGDLEGRL